MVDQFIAAGQAKWGQTSRLTLLLPDGYEGGGPEHSSARPERFLQLVAEGNLRVASPSGASNYYHLLRMQARSPIAVPLVIMTHLAIEADIYTAINVIDSLDVVHAPSVCLGVED